MGWSADLSKILGEGEAVISGEGPGLRTTQLATFLGVI